MKYKIKSKVWLWVGASGNSKGVWHFATVPPEISEKINKRYKDLHGGWGSLPVKATFKVGATPPLPGEVGEGPKIILETSIFKNRREQNYLTYILPIKKKIRQEVGLQDGDVIDFILEIRG